MDSSDSSDNEETKSRRRVRRKSKSVAKLALELGTPYSMLKERKTLALASSTPSEQDKRTKELISMLKVPTPKKKVALIGSGGSGIANGPELTQYQLVHDELKRVMPSNYTTWLLSKMGSGQNDEHNAIAIQGGSAGDSGTKHWIEQYMTELPEVFREPFHFVNVPKQIFSHAADAVYRSAYRVSHLNLALTEAGIDLRHWANAVSLAKARKTRLLRLRADFRNKLAMQPKTLDEESIWGLKPLRYQLTAPYLKTSDGLSAAPAHPNVDMWRNQLKHVPSEFLGKQNWMAKDINALKDSIRDFLIERKLFGVQVKAGVQLKECIQVKENELEGRRMNCMKSGKEEEEETAAESKKRGRPRKYGRQKVFASITPVLFKFNGGGDVRYRTNNADIQEWRDKKQDAIRKQKYPALVEELRADIEFDAVSIKVTAKTKKNRSGLDCYLAFKHEADPVLNCKRWSQQETKKLQTLVQKYGIHGIDKVTSDIGSNRSVFQCFQKWKNTNVKATLMHWDEAKDTQLNTLVTNTGGNWKKAAFQLDDDLATKNRVMDRYKKNTNPVLKSGQFSRVEDALLILTIEKLKPHIACEGHFGELIAYLPWRFETVWRDRAGNLFANFIVPWTIQEDKQLLEYANTMSRDWRKISDTFKSFKNRKGCLTRWKILQKRLKNFGSLEAYHESYSMTRYNVFQYKHLNEILVMLKKAVTMPRIDKVQVNPARPPTDIELGALMLSFDRQIMESAIEGLEKYVQQRDNTWKDVVRKVNERQKTFDRRTFHRDLSQSMASAIHIRGVNLIPREEITFQLNHYQEEVYKYHARFMRTKSLKRDAKRPYIPTAYELSQMPEVKDIVQPVEYQIDDDVKVVATRRSKRISRKRKAEPESDGEPELVDLVSDED